MGFLGVLLFELMIAMVNRVYVWDMYPCMVWIVQVCLMGTLILVYAADADIECDGHSSVGVCLSTGQV